MIYEFYLLIVATVMSVALFIVNMKLKTNYAHECWRNERLAYEKQELQKTITILSGLIIEAKQLETKAKMESELKKDKRMVKLK